MRTSRLVRSATLFLVLSLVTLLSACSGAKAPSGAVLLLHANGEINGVMADYLDRGIADAQGSGAGAVIIELDTPGGLDQSMRDIIQHLTASTVPVIVYVAPAGARAGSAGTFITEAAALAVMAPGTNIGAASPVSSDGGDIGGTEGRKIMNDSAAYIRSLAQQHGRNADWAESAVRKAASLPADEAKAQNVVDLVEPDTTALLQDADGRTVLVNGSQVQLHTAGRPLYAAEFSLAERVLDLLSDPNIAFLLLALGGLALAFEFLHPSVIAGVFGGILLLLGLYALGSLPTNWAGVILILLAFALFAADVHTGGSGVLAAGGVTALVLGGLLLFSSAGPAQEVSRLLLFATAGLIAVLFLTAISALYRSRKKPSVVGEQTLLGRNAVVRTALNPTGYVSIDGENWKATLVSETAEPGEVVTILEVRGLELRVRRAGEPALPPIHTTAEDA